MRPIHRWSLVALAVALVVLVPMTVRALPVHDEAISARDLLARVQARRPAAYSGMVEVHGRLGLPVSDHFTDVADLLGERHPDARVVAQRRPVAGRQAAADRRDRPVPPRPRDDPVGLRARRGADQPRPADPAAARRRPAAARAGAPAADRRRPGRRTPPPGPPRRRARRARAAARPSDPRTEHRPRRPVGRPRHRAGAARRGLRRRRRSRRSARRSRASTSASRRPRATTFHAARRAADDRVDDVLDIADAANQYAPSSRPPRSPDSPKSRARARAVGIYGSGADPGDGASRCSRATRRYLADQLRTSGAPRDRRQGCSLRVGPLGVAADRSRTGRSTSAGSSPAPSPTTRWCSAARDLDAGTRYRG